MNLILSNNQEELCQKFLSILKDKPASDDLFSQDVVLAQSFAMHHYLTLHISDYLKIAMAIRMFYPKTMVKMLYQWFFDEKKDTSNELLSANNAPENNAPENNLATGELSASELWETKNLRWILMEVLKKKKIELEEDKCFALAEEIAHLFDEYLLYRLPMLEKWQKLEQKPENQNRGGNTEKSLQKILWQEVCQILPVEKYPHHSKQIVALKNLFAGNAEKTDLSLKKKLRKICPRLFVFGISRTVPLYIDLWESMAKHTEVFVFALDYHCQKKSTEKGESPGEESTGGKSPEKKSTGEESTGEKIKKNPHLESPNLENSDRENWFIQTLKQKSSSIQTVIETTTFQSKKSSFLQAFKRFYLKQPLTQDKKYLKNPDNTLIVKKCSNIIDEVEVMCQTIINLLGNQNNFNHRENNSPNNPLHANDILVMAPNIDDYTLIIRDAFQTRGIPFSIADESLQDKNELSNELLDLLPLLKEENEWKLSHICKLAQSEYLSRKWHFYNHRENIEQWLKEARIRWGKKDHANSLESGIIRLINGYCMWLDDDHFKSNSDFFLKQPRFFFEGNSAEELGNFLNLLSHMQSYKEVSKKHTLKNWCSLIKKIAKSFFELPGNLMLENFFKKVNALENQQPDFLGISWQKISLETFLTALRQQLEGQKKERNYMTGRITFSSLVPMRAIPFKAVYLLGMGENEFVRKEKKASSLNLMHEQPMPYDRLRHLEDRQLFLDAFFSAQDYFFLSYSEVNKNNTSQKNPSTIFLEMVNDVEQYLDEEDLTTLTTKKAPTNQATPKTDLGNIDLLEKITHQSLVNQYDGRYSEGFDEGGRGVDDKKIDGKFLSGEKIKKMQEGRGQETAEEIKNPFSDNPISNANSDLEENTKTTDQIMLRDLCHYFGNTAESWLTKQGIQSSDPLPTADNFNDLEPLNSFEYKADGTPNYDNYDKRKIANDQLQSLSFWQKPLIDWHTLKDEGCLPHGEIGKREVEEINQQLDKIYKCGLSIIPELKNMQKRKWEQWLVLKNKKKSNFPPSSISLWGSIDYFAKTDDKNDLAKKPFPSKLPLLYCHYLKKDKDNKKSWPSLWSLMTWIIHSLFYFHISSYQQKSYFLTPYFFLTLNNGSDRRLDEGSDRKLDSTKELLKIYLNTFLEFNNHHEHFLPLLPKTSVFLLQQKLTQNWDEEKAKKIWKEEVEKSNTLKILYKNRLDDKKSQQREWQYILQTYEKFLMPLEKNLTYQEI